MTGIEREKAAETAKAMTTRQLVAECVRITREKKQMEAELNRYKHELEARAEDAFADHNVHFVKYYGDGGGSVSVKEKQTLDIDSPDKLKAAVGDGVWDVRVQKNVSVKYKCDPKFEQMLKAVFLGNYSSEMSLEEFLDEMEIKPDAKQKRLLLKKLKGDFEKDRALLQSVLVPEGEEAPDFDVELWYIHKIRNWELICRFLPEEGIDRTMAEIRDSVTVELGQAVTVDYDDEEEE